jgi:metal-sulfur cluster biosynthetic enzyme
MVTEERVMGELRALAHPAVDYSVVELGMVKKVVVEGNKVMVTLNSPCAEVPIKDLLAQSVKRAIAKVDKTVEVEIYFAVMGGGQREESERDAQEKWNV